MEDAIAIGGGFAWTAVVAAVFPRLLPRGREGVLTRAGGVRCLLGAVVGVALLAAVMWITKALPKLDGLLIALAVQVVLVVLLVGFANSAEPGREILGVGAGWRRDLLRGAAGWVLVVPLVIGALWLNHLLLGEEAESAHQPVQEVLAKPGAERIVLVLNVALVVPVFEEVLFRGLLQQGVRAQLAVALPPLWSSVASVLLASVAFTVLHPPATYVPVFVLSLILGAAYERSRRLLVPVALHSVHNAAVVAYELVTQNLGNAR
jgi:membrane protease YdiL (CAAX protease family)